MVAGILRRAIKVRCFFAAFLDRDHTNHKNPFSPLFLRKGFFKVRRYIQTLSN
ncbi:hypothetical protein HMPREF9065_00726 [Aggregatibacter sp. oral taxon 458 str. W10330]|nr:hypothetical protein HMPREF9065_00726 [Aggregatibacter sp. oral taxon 458 str. W10330]